MIEKLWLQEFVIIQREHQDSMWNKPTKADAVKYLVTAMVGE